jgi:hypothetical protein
MVNSTRLLNAFRHPLVLISILLLLLNDHIFKASMPSALTGKLSDLAGLFFFPFLVGTLLQGLVHLVRPARRLPARRALLVSFALSAAVFSAIKTLPGVNGFMAGLLATLFQLPVRIALDPTDLLALVMFFPAWKLWNHIEKNRQPAVPGKLGFAVLGLGALACVATSPCMPVSSIQRLVSVDGALYARMEPNNAVGLVSRDLGDSWEGVQPMPAEIFAGIAEPLSLPLTLCDPADERMCYRISGQPWVEGSQDGGASWHTAWRIPPERESYIRRVNSGGLAGCGKTPNFVPLDMTFVYQPEGSILVVAMGNEGIVIHPPAGDWQRTAVGPSIIPTPTAAGSLDEAFNNTGLESILGLAGAVVIYLGLSLWAWIFAARHVSPYATRTPKWVFRPAWVALGWILLIVALQLGNGIIQGMNRNAHVVDWQIINTVNTVLLIAEVTLPLGLLLINLAIWIRAGNLAARPGQYRLHALLAVLIGVGMAVILSAGLLLWALGVIAAQETALWLAAIISLGFLGWGVIQMRRGMRRALVGAG